MMTITVELLNEEALALLQNLERLNILKLFPSYRQPAGETIGKEPSQTKPRPRFGSAKGMFVEPPTSDASQESQPGKFMAKGPVTLPPGFNEPLENYPAGFGCMKGMIHLAPDWDEPLEDFKEYMY